MTSISDLIGKTFLFVRQFQTEFDGDELIFETETEKFIFYHHQDCCENVYLDNITGNLEDLVGVPLLIAEQREQEGENSDGYGTSTWTFYEFRTLKGSVTVRWIGESNGYYSESVDLRKEIK